MTLKINLAKQTNKKFLDKLSPKQFKQIFSKILLLTKEPFPGDSWQLRGDDAFCVDVGEFRIIYEIQNKTLNILLIGKRNDSEVYKKYFRKR